MSIYNTPLEERFGEKLEELREGKNMTREQLADQVGLTARHIAALERGERRPTLNTMEKLLRTLGAPTEWLIYPEFEEQNARLHEISHLAATFSDEQQEFLLGIMRLMRKQKCFPVLYIECQRCRRIIYTDIIEYAASVFCRCRLQSPSHF